MKKHAFRHFTSILLFASLSFTFGCEEDPDDVVVDNSPIPNPLVPTVETNKADSVEFIMAKSGGKITANGGSRILYYGICWGTSPNPTVELSTKTRIDIDINLPLPFEFKHYPKLAKGQTKYYIRAYAVNKAGVSYGLNDSIVTKPTRMVDKSGFEYFTNLIGNQVWSRHNLRTSLYGNDSAGNIIAIRNLPNNATPANTIVWKNALSGLSCFYNDRNININFFGLLYNYYVVENPLNVCPTGWHVPSVSEWDTLIKYSGMVDQAGKNLKGQALNSPNYSDLWPTKPNPRDNFSAIPGGLRDKNGVFSNGPGSGGVGGIEGTYWTSTLINDSTAYSFSIKDNDSKIYKVESHKKNGHSIRCVWNGEPL